MGLFIRFHGCRIIGNIVKTKHIQSNNRRHLDTSAETRVENPNDNEWRANEKGNLQIIMGRNKMDGARQEAKKHVESARN